MSIAAADIAGLVLAGGQARRLGGGDKPLREIGGRAMLAHILERLAPQVGPVAISANGDPTRFARFGLPVLPDEGNSAGPLSGILAGMAWAKALGSTRLLTVAGDTPFFPRDLASRLAAAAAIGGEGIPVAASGGRRHPVFALWPVALEADLRAFLAGISGFSVSAFLDRHGAAEVAFPMVKLGNRSLDPFFNVNTSAELAEADAVARGENP